MHADIQHTQDFRTIAHDAVGHVPVQSTSLITHITIGI